MSARDDYPLLARCELSDDAEYAVALSQEAGAALDKIDHLEAEIAYCIAHWKPAPCRETREWDEWPPQ